ncbi:substrate-binding domain-containing protein [Phenylobacterium sp. J367]|uniref:substrate-binding domain-containing protein n=1 Tax=Phenylobacterium sp. J367 TaxID=2898435 RepID=UPI002150FB27|nr:substrate-binding domain-containing protein [Phenylobacterium sp. J367]MCR5881022.1 substrate-binding domain-containing protein [Phenylobacterium sp. J367]
MRLTLLLTAAAVALTACGQQPEPKVDAQVSGGGGARNQVWAAGSSTVFPFATRVAETVGRTTGGTAAKVESLGTGGGIKLFCSGTGAGFPDIATASRAMKKSEWDACQAAGVTEIVELKFGFDGIVVADAKSAPTFAVTREQIYRALAAELPQGSGFAPNTAATWSAVAPGLPNERVLVYGPPPTSGTRDAFVELAMEKGAEKLPAMAALKKSNEDEFKAKSHTLRRDGAWVDAGENDNAIVQTLEKTPGAVGVFGYSFLENNLDKVKAASVEGVAPTFETISNGSYPLARSLYIYVKKANVGVTPGLREYVNAFVSDAAAGKGGYLQQRGLIALPQAEHEQVKATAQALTPMAAPTK